jgi:hypothetical protein
VVRWQLREAGGGVSVVGEVMGWHFFWMLERRTYRGGTKNGRTTLEK